MLMSCIREAATPEARYQHRLNDYSLKCQWELERWRFASEEEPYACLATILGLDARARVMRKRTDLEGNGTREPAILALHEIEINRAQVLIAAIGRLYFFEFLLSYAGVWISAESVRKIEDFLTEHQPFVPERSSAAATAFRTVDAVLHRARNRQRFYPIQRTLESLELGQGPSREGQMFAT